MERRREKERVSLFYCLYLLTTTGHADAEIIQILSITQSHTKKLSKGQVCVTWEKMFAHQCNAWEINC